MMTNRKRPRESEAYQYFENATVAQLLGRTAPRTGAQRRRNPRRTATPRERGRSSRRARAP
eukprot:6371673-Lingulodinium_polyedra.AAC.1